MTFIKYCLPVFISLFVLQAPVALAETISIGGSTTVEKYIQLAAKAYTAIHPDITFSINGGGSTAGFAESLDQRVHIGMMSREMAPQEVAKSGDIKHIAIALDAVVPVVSKEIYASGIHHIKPGTLAQIYQGQITNWNILGGPNRHIIVVDKNIYHGTREVFAHYVLGETDAPKVSVSVILDSDVDVLRLIHSSDQAIGYVGIGYVDQDVHMLGLQIKGRTVSATHENIRSGSYPMSRKLYLLLPRKIPGYVQGFVDFILSVTGQAIVKQAGFLPIRE